MSNANQTHTGTMRHLWEALFSLHLALAGMCVTFMASRAVAAPFLWMEFRINSFLHIRNPGFIGGLFSSWTPSVLAAFLIWVLLRVLARTDFIHAFLRSFAGIITILVPLAFWIFYYEYRYEYVGWLYGWSAFETVIALALTLLFLSGKWLPPFWASILLLVWHYAFWYFTRDSHPFTTNYMGPAGPILGVCSATAWVAYVNRLRKVSAAADPAAGLDIRPS